jgi:hypothetical protein
MGKATPQHAKPEKLEPCRTALALEPVQQREHEAPNTGTNQHEKVKCISQYDDLARASEIEAPSSQDKILSSQNLASNNMQRPRTTPSGAPPRAGSTGYQRTQSVKTVAVAEAASATAAHYTDVYGANDAGSKSHVCGLANVPVLSESDHDSAVTTDEGEASEEESEQTASYQYSSDTERCEDPQDSEHATSTKRVDMEASYQYSSDNESCEYPQDLEHRSTCQVLGGGAPSAPATCVGGSKVLCRTGSMRGSVQMSPITSCQLCLV